MDCQYLVVGGMGAGAYESMQHEGIKPIVTDLSSIDEAVQAWGPEMVDPRKHQSEYYCTEIGFIFQISLAYSPIVLSVEKIPERATLMMAILFHASWSV